MRAGASKDSLDANRIEKQTPPYVTLTTCWTVRTTIYPCLTIICITSLPACPATSVVCAQALHLDGQGQSRSVFKCSSSKCAHKLNS
ncbi:hypothetical protein DUNSADRAFT_1579 [Dunaliella salina]|uniref:Encoded protein n=1 Tax=Dunaliella salina TaxID=3046 RepID=A0ABQ7H8H5_DUNSA|nr:hypothetical protein DUNSADRAFT_1579 [Dunaliella salina]|eukprot:KAF5843152.1 hypothetical protein DUNSADRAFT_1579 [Dunaliella salina]